MLEGGNEQLNTFFQRHSLAPIPKTRNNNRQQADPIIEKRFKTKAAQFYREQLKVHIGRVKVSGEYQGREKARRMSTVRNKNISDK